MIAALLFVVSLAMTAVSLLVVGRATTVFHEIEGGVLFVAAAVVFSGAFIVNSVDVARRRIVKSLEDLGERTDRLGSKLTSSQQSPPNGTWPAITSE